MDVLFDLFLVCRPTGEISFPDEYHGLFTDDLVSIPEGSVLWNVFAMDAPTELGGTEQWIGKHDNSLNFIWIKLSGFFSSDFQFITTTF